MGDILNIKDQKKIPHLDFVRSCVEMLLMVHGAEKNGCRPTIAPGTLEVVKKDQGNHMIVKTKKANVCRNCKDEKNLEKRTCYRCGRCDVGLHPDCFEAYHS